MSGAAGRTTKGVGPPVSAGIEPGVLAGEEGPLPVAVSAAGPGGEKYRKDA